MKSLDSMLGRKQRHVVVSAITILTAASAALALSAPTTAENNGLLAINAIDPHVLTQETPADVQIPTGVRLTIADHERIAKQIQADTGITISDWVWENYSESVDRLEAARDTTLQWLNKIPKEWIHGQPPPDAPTTTWERRDAIVKRTLRNFELGLLELEDQYYNALSLHQVSDDLITDLRYEVCRRHLLPKNRRFPGANVDVLALLSGIEDDFDDTVLGALHPIKTSYAREMMGLLLKHAAALAAERAANPTMFEFLHGVDSAQPWRGRNTQRAKAAIIESDISIVNQEYLARFTQEVGDGARAQLTDAWNRAMYPFLWPAGLKTMMARASASDDIEPRSLVEEITGYQQAAQRRLWNAQRKAADPEYLMMRANAASDAADQLWNEYTSIQAKCTAVMDEYTRALAELNASAGDMP